jgi:hypothetical protein
MKDPNSKYHISNRHLSVQEVIYGYERTSLIILPPGFWERRDEILPVGEAFLKGVRLYDYPNISYEFWANTSNCFHGYTNFTWAYIPSYFDYITRTTPSWWNKI